MHTLSEIIEASYNYPIVFFDGQCALCNRAVCFIAKYEKSNQMRFASLENPKYKESIQSLLLEQNLDTNSMLYVFNGQFLDKSTAAVRIASHLRKPFSYLAATKVFPKFIRDFGYSLISRTRHLWVRSATDCSKNIQRLSGRFV